MNLSNEFRIELKRLKRNLIRIQTGYEKEIPDYLLKELANITGTIGSLEMFGHLDLVRGE